MKANQRVALGANGVDLNSGSPLQLQEDTELMGNVDALRIRSNYTDEAQNLNDKATLVRSEGAMAKSAGNKAFTTSLIMAAGGVAAGWYSAGSASSLEVGATQSGYTGADYSKWVAGQ